MNLDLAAFEPVLKALAIAGLPTLENALTTVLSDAVLGPAGPLISPVFNGLWAGINRAIGLAPDTAPEQTAAAIQADPDGARDKLAAVQEQHAYLLDSFKAQAAVDSVEDAAQNAINAKAAESASFFVYGYRPAIVWGLGFLTVAYGGAPLFGWLAAGLGWRLGEAPTLPWYVWTILAALLGIIAALRSWDKSNGTAALPPAAPNARRR